MNLVESVNTYINNILVIISENLIIKHHIYIYMYSTINILWLYEYECIRLYKYDINIKINNVYDINLLTCIMYVLY